MQASAQRRFDQEIPAARPETQGENKVPKTVGATGVARPSDHRMHS